MTGLQISTLLFVGAIMLLVLVLSIVIGDGVTHEKRIISRRIGLIIGEKEKQEKKVKKKVKKGEDGTTFVIKSSLYQRFSDRIFDELLAADIMMKPDEFITMWAALITVPALLSALFIKHPLLPMVLAIVFAVGPFIIVKNKQKKRVKAFEEQLSDALLISCNCLRSGLTFAQAMENIAEEMEAPIGTEFKRAVNEMNFGATLEEALESLVKRINSPDLVFTVAAVNIQRQTGGNLSEILEIIANTIRERGKIKAEIKTLTTQGKASGIVIGVLPIALGLILSVINPDYMMTFFTTSIGNILLIISIVLEVIGFVLINKIVDIKY